MNKYIPANFFELQGQIIRDISVDEGDGDVSITTDKFVYIISHEQDCCETVRVFEIRGDKSLILNRPILLAEEDNAAPDVDKDYRFGESYTWTQFVLRTEAGQFAFWFLGESNGYYSESVNVTKRNI